MSHPGLFPALILAASIAVPCVLAQDDEFPTRERIDEVLHWLKERAPEKAEHLVHLFEEGEDDEFLEAFRRTEKAMEEERRAHEKKEREGKDREDRPLPPEVVEEVLRHVRKENPEHFEKLERLRAENAEEFFRVVKKIAEELERRHREEKDREGEKHEDRPLPPEVVEEVLRHVREEGPEHLEKLERMREENPDEFRRVIQHIAEELERRRREEKDREGEKHEDRPLPPEAVEEVLRKVREENPEHFEKLVRLREKNPDEFLTVIRKVAEEMERQHREKKDRPPHDARPGDDPEAREDMKRQEELERRAKELAEAFRRAEGPDHREELRGKLRETLGAIFEIRESMRHRELERLQHEIEEMRQALERRRENREAIIEKKLREMTGEGNDLDW